MEIYMNKLWFLCLDIKEDTHYDNSSFFYKFHNIYEYL